MRHLNLSVAAMGVALSMAGPAVAAPERPQRRRRETREPPKYAPREAIPYGDGFDQERIERAEMKRARKAAKLLASLQGVG